MDALVPMEPVPAVAFTYEPQAQKYQLRTVAEVVAITVHYIVESKPIDATS